MGKCASKDIINGQIVPNAELDAGSPMFAPEAPATVGAETTTDAGAGAEVTFQGFSPAPVEPVAAALPQPRGVSVDGPMAGNQYSQAYPVHPAGGPLDGKLFMSLEEAEAAARKQNEAWGVAHIPYDPNTNTNNYGQATANYEQPNHVSYADAFPPSQQHPSEPRPAEPTSADEHQAARPAYHEQQHDAPAHVHQQASGYQPASPERPSVGGQRSGGVHESLPPAHNAYPPVVAEQPQHASPEAAPVAAPVAEPVAAEPQIQTVSVPEAAPAPAEDAAVVPATDSKKKKKKSSKKSKNWAWF